MRVPDYLTDYARDYWKRHAKRLENSGLLTEADVESFALLCEVWGLIRTTNPHADSKEAIKYIGLIKQYQALGKQFGMFAKDRRAAKIETAKIVTDEFGIPQ